VNCEGCGAELKDGAKFCNGCGREVGLGHRAAGETEHLAKETGKIAGKLGRGLVGGAKGLAAGAKKGYQGTDEETKSS